MNSLEFTQQEVDILKGENKVLKDEVRDLKTELNKNNSSDESLRKIQNRLDYQEDYSRRNNLRIDGLDEKNNETWEETEEKVQRLLRDTLGMGAVALERAHRVGPSSRPGAARPRAIVARFCSFPDRQRALRNSAKLRNTNIYLNEDLCESSVQARKAQLPALKKAKADGKIAFFSHTRLIIRDRGSRTDGGSTAAAVGAAAPAVGAAVPADGVAAGADAPGGGAAVAVAAGTAAAGAAAPTDGVAALSVGAAAAAADVGAVAPAADVSISSPAVSTRSTVVTRPDLSVKKGVRNKRTNR